MKKRRLLLFRFLSLFMLFSVLSVSVVQAQSKRITQEEMDIISKKIQMHGERPNLDQQVPVSLKTKEAGVAPKVVYLNEGFESGSLPTGWLNIDSDDDGYLWGSAATADNPAHTGNYSFYSASFINYFGAINPDNWLITPRINIIAAGCKLSYWIGAQDPEWPAEHYSVLVSTTNTSLSSFTPVFTETLTSGDWKKVTIDLADYVGEQIYIAFRHFDCTDNFGIKIDDILIKDDSPYSFNVTIPNDVKVDVGTSYKYKFVINNDGTVDDSYTVNWDEGDGYFSYSLLDSDGTTPLNNGFSIVAGASKTLYYQVSLYAFVNDGVTNNKVIAINSNGDNTLSVVDTVKTTAVNSIFNESFETAVPPAGWSVDNVGPGFIKSSTQVNSGSFSAFHNDDSYDCSDWLITPAIKITSKAQVLRYSEYVNYSSFAKLHEVYVSTSSDMSGAVLINDVIGTEDTWVEKEFSLAAFEDQTIYIGFFYQGFNRSEWYIDDVKVSAPKVFWNEIYSYSFKYVNGNAQIDQDSKEIFATVPFDTGLDTLTAIFGIKSLDGVARVNGKKQVSGVTKNNFTNPVVYAVSDENGITRNYTVYVERAEPVTAFTLTNATNVQYYNDTVWVTLTANANFADQVVTFAMADPSYELYNGETLLVSGTSKVDFTNPVILTAKAGNIEKDYTIVASKEGALTAFAFYGYIENDIVNNFESYIYGDIDYASKTVSVTVPYGIPVDSIITLFGTKPYVTSVAYDGITISNGSVCDYEIEGSLILTLADAKGTEEYVVKVSHDEGSYQNEILSVTNIPNLVGSLQWDNYGRRISGEVMYDSTLVIKPKFVVSSLASIADTAVAHNFAEGPANYTVRSQNGIEAVWQLSLTEAAPSNEAKVLTFLHNDQFDGWVDKNNIFNIADPEINLANVKVELTTSFGATVAPEMVSPSVVDFTKQPVIYKVTAQDSSVVSYNAYITPIDEDAPVVSLTAITIGNATDTISVKIKDAATVLGLNYALVHKSIQGNFASIVGNNNTMQQAIASGLIVTGSSDEGVTDTIFKLPALGLKAGVYRAIAQDAFDNMSAFTADSIVIGVDTISVSNFADMEIFNNVIYKYTGQAVITFAQDFRNQKFVQDATMGMLIDDSVGYTVSVGTTKIVAGDVITGIYGKLVNYNNTIEFQPIQKSVNTVSVTASGKTVEPIELTFEEFNSNLFDYQNMLVKLSNVSFNDADNSNYFTNGAIYDITDNAFNGSAKFRTTFYDVDYIGSYLPEGVFNIVGIKNIRDNQAVLSARSNADFDEITTSIFAISPEEWTINTIGISPDVNEFTISNMGVENIEISNIYIEGAPEFVMATIKNVTVEPYSSYSFDVNFVPAAYGSYTAEVLIEFADGTVNKVALSATVSEAFLAQFPYSTTFNTQADVIGWSVENYGLGSGFQWGEGLGSTNSFYRVGYENTGYVPSDEALLLSPIIDMSDAKSPKVEWNNTMIIAGYATTALLVSVNGGSFMLVDYIETEEQVITPLAFELETLAGASKVQFAFYIYEPDGGYGSPVTWWDIDDFKVYDVSDVPVFDITAQSVDFGACESTETKAIKISNTGASYFTLNSITLKEGSAPSFKLVEVPSAPVDVYTNSVTFGVSFDATLGENSGVVVVTYSTPRDGVQTLELPVTGIGVACSEATLAVVGENQAPHAPVWFEYTPSNDELLTISSEASGADTDLKVLDACNGNVVASNDDINSEAKIFSSKVTFPARSGVTYKIHWLGTWEKTGFAWTLESASIPTAPVLLSVNTMAMNADSAKATLSFTEMYQFEAQARTYSADKNGIKSGLVSKKLTHDVFEIIELEPTRDWAPEGTAEVEPNNGLAAANKIEIGTAASPTAITGYVGGPSDASDFFVFETDESGYINGSIDMQPGGKAYFMIYADFDGDGSFTYIIYVLTETFGTIKTELVPATEYYVRIMADGSFAAPGAGYNYKLWFSQPSYVVYRDNFKIAGPEPMGFTYTDEIPFNREFCYSVAQIKNDGKESDKSNSICVTAQPSEGDICVFAKEIAVNNRYLAPRAPYWYKITPSESMSIKISSNVEGNDPEGNDTRLVVYETCDIASPGDDAAADFIAYSEDVDYAGKIFTSEVEFVALEGKTYLVYWHDIWSKAPFYFEVTSSELKEGDFVETAIPLTLPVIDMDGTTSGFAHNYNATPCGTDYMGGNDIVYTFEVPYGGTISGNITGTYVGMFVISGTPDKGSCVASAKGATTGSFTNRKINKGKYYVIVSTQSPTKETDFVMNLSYTPADKETITYNVDMNNQIILGKFNKTSQKVYVGGTFNGWESVEMLDADGDGVYTYESPVEYYPGEYVRYKYNIDNDLKKAEFSSSIDDSRIYNVVSGSNSTSDLFNNEELPEFKVRFIVQMARQYELKAFDPASDVIKLSTSLISKPVVMTDPNNVYLFEYQIENVKYGEITFQAMLNNTPENVNRTARITKDTTISVWFNNDNSVDVNFTGVDKFNVYPNPATDMLTIELAAKGKTTLSVVNIEGKVVKTIDVNNQAFVNINVNEFAKGVYQIKALNNDNVIVRKLVVE